MIGDKFTPGELAPVKLMVNTEGKEVPLQQTFTDLSYVSHVSEAVEGSSNPDIQAIDIEFNLNPYSNEAMALIPELRAQFWNDVTVPGSGAELNQSLEKAGRVADFLELGELMCLDALERRESCGGHFREEYQTEDNEADRDDANFQHVAAWEYAGEGRKPIRNVEALDFEYVHPSKRSYK